MKILKLVSVILLLAVMKLQAQTELKINPLGLLFGSPDVSVEFALNNSASLEPFVGFTSRNTSIGDESWKLRAVNAGASFKYFFNPHRGIDRFYVGAYSRFNTGTWKFDSDNITSTRVAVGLLIGQKWVSRKNIVFELAFGAGRALYNHLSDDTDSYDGLLWNLDLMGRLSLGYRFGGDK